MPWLDHTPDRPIDPPDGVELPDDKTLILQSSNKLIDHFLPDVVSDLMLMANEDGLPWAIEWFNRELTHNPDSRILEIVISELAAIEEIQQDWIKRVRL